MSKAGVVSRPARGQYVITARGAQVLADNARRVDMAVLSAFPEYVAFRTSKPPDDADPSAELGDLPLTTEVSPSEAVDKLVREADSGVAAELLDRVLAQGRRGDQLSREIAVSISAMWRTQAAAPAAMRRRDPAESLPAAGGGDEKTSERPVLTVPQVFDLAGRMREERFRALILVATFGSLRWGEVTALRRADVDLTRGTVRVRAAFIERQSGAIELGPPKSRASVRVVGLPAALLPVIREHLDAFAEPGAEGLVFVGAKGRPLRRSNFNKATH